MRSGTFLSMRPIETEAFPMQRKPRCGLYPEGARGSMCTQVGIGLQGVSKLGGQPVFAMTFSYYTMFFYAPHFQARL
jgi:hypothetical protein